jgi:hypothetical protein
LINRDLGTLYLDSRLRGNERRVSQLERNVR